jgi:signal transduction histidine kinase
LTASYDEAIRSMWVTERLEDLALRLVDAETGQRGYLLVRRPVYLDPYTAALPKIDELRREIGTHYGQRNDAQQLQSFSEVSRLIGIKLSELEQTLEAARSGRTTLALQVVGTDVGQETMEQIRGGIAALQAREREHTYSLMHEWQASVQLSRAGIAAITALNIVLLALITRWMKRDWLRAHEREQELDRLVSERTAQLANLATCLQDVSETEKTRVGRELHDELGSTLTAVKMDVAWTRTKLAPEQALLGEKLDRAARNIDQCIQVKRRIIEDLRPTTLANFGFMTAARELAVQTAERAGWRLKLELPDVDPNLSEETEIALFRILQETLNNAAKYARATTVRVSLVCDRDACAVEIEDDGIGFRPREVRPKASGLIGMRQRVEPHGGRFHIESKPGRGTLVRVSVPIHTQSQSPGPQASQPVPRAPEEGIFG